LCLLINGKPWQQKYEFRKGPDVFFATGMRFFMSNVVARQNGRFAN
jgi:hypothetical protein